MPPAPCDPGRPSGMPQGPLKRDAVHVVGIRRGFRDGPGAPPAQLCRRSRQVSVKILDAFQDALSRPKAALSLATA